MSKLFKETPFPDQKPLPRRKRDTMLQRTSSLRGRMFFLVGVFALCFSVLALRMGQISLNAKEAAAPRSAAPVMRPVRARLLDRNGRVIASTLQTWEVKIDPSETARAGGISPDALYELGEIFPNLDQSRLRRLVERGTSRFEYIERTASPLQWANARQLGIIGMTAEPRVDRVYPAGRLVAHIVGGVNIDNRGVAGIERGLEDRVGRDGPGEPVALSIDLRIQNALRTTMSEAGSRFAALASAGLVMDVRTGEILAMVSLPDFDPNHRPVASANLDPDQHAASPLFNRVTQGVYELGSTFKLLTAAMALESGVAQVDTLVDARFAIRRGGYPIRDYRGKGRFLTLEEVIRYSSNIGAVRIAELVGPDRQQFYLDRFGIGGRVPLAEYPTAELGIAQLPQKWESAESATVAYGHGIAVTQLHLATAIASIANDGCRVTPTLLRRDPEPGCDRVVSREVSDNVRALMRLVSEASSGRSANIAGYEIGGKTGTAYKVKASGGYDLDKRFNTFVAIWPTSEPQYLLMLSLDNPKLLDGTKRLPLAGRTAAPVAGRAIERIAPLLGLAPADRFRPTIEGDDEITEGGALPIFLDDPDATE